MNRPTINVTPLIDVLLVLLIIFMTVTPLRPSAFRARVPVERKELPDIVENAPDTLLITVAKDRTMLLNNKPVGSTDDTSALSETLQTVFDLRMQNGDVSQVFADDPERPMTDKIERTVFIRAPKSLDYGSVARIVDAAKSAGAFPVSLQIDRLDQ